jgi:hypothetical protein
MIAIVTKAGIAETSQNRSSRHAGPGAHRAGFARFGGSVLSLPRAFGCLARDISRSRPWLPRATHIGYQIHCDDPFRAIEALAHAVGYPHANERNIEEAQEAV